MPDQIAAVGVVENGMVIVGLDATGNSMAWSFLVRAIPVITLPAAYQNRVSQKSQRSGCARGLLIQARQHAQEAGQFAQFKPLGTTSGQSGDQYLFTDLVITLA